VRGFLLAAALLTVACATVPVQSEFMEQQGVKVSSEALRTRLRSEVIPFTGLMEQAADSARAASTDPAVQRRLLVWKINVVPALYRTLFNQRPMVALLDTWTLLLQVEGYLRSPQGKATMGPGSPQVLATAIDLESRVQEIVAWAAPGRDLKKVRAMLERWADEHPVQSTFATRDGVEQYLSTVTPTEELGVLVVAGRMNEDLDGLVARMDYLPVVLPRQATWQAELTYMDLIDPRLDIALTRGAQALEKFDDMLTWLGKAGLEVFAEEQRVQLVRAIDIERVEVARLLERERTEVEAFVRRERTAFMADAQRLVDHAAEEAARRAGEVVDRAVTRIAILLGAAVAVFALLGWAVRRKGRGT